MIHVSVATVLLSALLSIITGFIGVLLSGGRQRRQERRVYGLALLAEIKSIQRSLSRYSRRIDIYGPSQSSTGKRLGQEVKLWRHDLSVYANNSGRIGLFSVRTAIEIIEFYHRVRWLDIRTADLDHLDNPDEQYLLQWLQDHQESIRSARLHSRYLSRLLRREVPATWAEELRGIRRRAFKAAASKNAFSRSQHL